MAESVSCVLKLLSALSTTISSGGVSSITCTSGAALMSPNCGNTPRSSNMLTSASITGPCTRKALSSAAVQCVWPSPVPGPGERMTPHDDERTTLPAQSRDHRTKHEALLAPPVTGTITRSQQRRQQQYTRSFSQSTIQPEAYNDQTGAASTYAPPETARQTAILLRRMNYPRKYPARAVEGETRGFIYPGNKRHFHIPTIDADVYWEGRLAIIDRLYFGGLYGMEADVRILFSYGQTGVTKKHSIFQATHLPLRNRSEWPEFKRDAQDRVQCGDIATEDQHGACPLVPNSYSLFFREDDANFLPGEKLSTVAMHFPMHVILDGRVSIVASLEDESKERFHKVAEKHDALSVLSFEQRGAFYFGGEHDCVAREQDAAANKWWESCARRTKLRVSFSRLRSAWQPSYSAVLGMSGAGFLGKMNWKRARSASRMQSGESLSNRAMTFFFITAVTSFDLWNV
ncbi:hypothetical protein BKA63DRAFT_494150 [Paraphoma chrysanthemicola]|nr:hypothetical protein BKA63DRAFT_494150 [Paraphoma chrysanthemicola]